MTERKVWIGIAAFVALGVIITALGNHLVPKRIIYDSHQECGAGPIKYDC
jgi:hypothetical protein